MLLKSRETLIPSLAGLQALCGISSWPHSSLTSAQPYQPSPPSESLEEIIFIMLYPRPPHHVLRCFDPVGWTWEIVISRTLAVILIYNQICASLL